MKKLFLLVLVLVLVFGCATARTDTAVKNPVDSTNPPAMPTAPADVKAPENPALLSSPSQSTPTTPAESTTPKMLNMDVTDMSTASRNTLSEKEDPNLVKYPGVSIPNMAKKEKLNNAFIRSGRGEIDTNPYSPSGVSPEDNNNASNQKTEDYGIESPVQKEQGNKIMLKTDAITNPKDENISPSYNVSNESGEKEKKNKVADYRKNIGIKNIVKKEINDKISVKTGRDVGQENPTGNANGSKGSASNLNGIQIQNPVQKSTKSFIENKRQGIGLWE